MSVSPIRATRRSPSQHRGVRAVSPSATAVAVVRPPFSTFAGGRADHGTSVYNKSGNDRYRDVVNERFHANIQKKWFNFDTAVKLASLERTNALHAHRIINARPRVDSSCPRALEILEEDGRIRSLSPKAEAAKEAHRAARARQQQQWRQRHRAWLGEHYEQMNAFRATVRHSAAFAQPAAVEAYVRSSAKELELARRAASPTSSPSSPNAHHSNSNNNNGNGSHGSRSPSPASSSGLGDGYGYGCGDIVDEALLGAASLEEDAALDLLAVRLAKGRGGSVPSAQRLFALEQRRRMGAGGGGASASALRLRPQSAGPIVGRGRRLSDAAPPSPSSRYPQYSSPQAAQQQQQPQYTLSPSEHHRALRVGGSGGASPSPLSPASMAHASSAAAASPSGGQRQRPTSAASATASAAGKALHRRHGHLPPDERREVLRAELRWTGGAAPPSHRAAREAAVAAAEAAEEAQRRTNPTPRQLFEAEVREERRASRRLQQLSPSYVCAPAIASGVMHANASPSTSPYAANSSGSGGYYNNVTDDAIMSPQRHCLAHHPTVAAAAPETIDPSRTLMSPAWRGRLRQTIDYARGGGGGVADGASPAVRNTLCLQPSQFTSPQQQQQQGEEAAAGGESPRKTRQSAAAPLLRSTSDASSASLAAAAAAGVGGGLSRAGSTAALQGANAHRGGPHHRNGHAATAAAAAPADGGTVFSFSPARRSRDDDASPLASYGWAWA